MQLTDEDCQPVIIAPYVEGELDPAAVHWLEQHLKDCAECTEELRFQRLMVTELDSTFSVPPDLEVPRDFARIVAAQAESDMSGARTGPERKKALQLILLLGLTSFALLGTTAVGSLIAAAQLPSAKIVFVTSLLAKALYDAGAGLSVMLRVAGGALLADAFSVLVFLLLLLAVLILTILISAYHRYPRRGLYE
jgi:anti-sigma factor RsiW